MERNSPTQPQSTLHRLLPAMVLFAALVSEPFALIAQPGENPAAGQPSPSSLLQDQSFQATPEEIGDTHMARQRYHQAINAYHKVPNPSPVVWNKMGVAYQMLLDLKDAARCYRESLRLKPGMARPLNNLGTVYDAQNDYAKAEHLYRQALQANPTMATAARNLGTNLMFQKRFKEGTEMYKHALALDPDILDRPDAAVTRAPVHLDQAGAINYYKAKNLAEAGMASRAVKYLRRALNEGFTTVKDIVADSSFTSLHGNSAFEKLKTDREMQ